MEKKVFNFAEITNSNIGRISTGFKQIDEMYSFNKDGLPRSAASVWAGSAGCGKTRTALQVSSNVSKKFKVLLFSLEENLSSIKNKIKLNSDSLKNYFVSTENNHNNQIKIIKEVKPDLIIIDSVSMIENYTNVYQSETIINELLVCNRENNSHMILISQLNKSVTKNNNTTDNIRGSSMLVFLADVAVKFYKFELDNEKIKNITSNMNSFKKNNFKKIVNLMIDQEKGWYIMSIPSKNRYGPSDKKIVLKHEPEKISVVNIRDSFFKNLV